MGKTLIIKGADFSKVNITIDIPDIEPDIPDTPVNKPETDMVLIEELIQSNKLLHSDLQVGDAVNYLETQHTAGYFVWSVPIEYTGATYRLVGNTKFGAGLNTDYCVFAVVLDSENVVLGVIYANSNSSSLVENDTYEIDVSKYNNPASIQFCNYTDIEVTVLAS